MFLTLPGIYDSGPAHWQSRWEAAEPHLFVRFAPSDWDEPDPPDWVAALDRAVVACAEPPVLVAHSLSCLLVPLWAQGSGRVAGSVAAALLVAPVDPAAPAFPAAAAGFRGVAARPLPFPALVVGSADDPYAAESFSRRFAADLGAAYVSAGACGHINADSGLGDWPWGRALATGLAAGAVPNPAAGP